MKIKREKIFSGTPWEPKLGYSRAIKVGDMVYVSGTTGTDPSGKVLAPGNIYAQSVQAIRNIEDALKRLGLGLEYVVRTRIYVTKIELMGGSGESPREIFRYCPSRVHPGRSLEVHRPRNAGGNRSHCGVLNG